MWRWRQVEIGARRWDGWLPQGSNRHERILRLRWRFHCIVASWLAHCCRTLAIRAHSTSALFRSRINGSRRMAMIRIRTNTRLRTIEFRKRPSTRCRQPPTFCVCCFWCFHTADLTAAAAAGAEDRPPIHSTHSVGAMQCGGDARHRQSSLRLFLPCAAGSMRTNFAEIHKLTTPPDGFSPQ